MKYLFTLWRNILKRLLHTLTIPTSWSCIASSDVFRVQPCSLELWEFPALLDTTHLELITQETSVLKTSDCLVQLKQLGDCFPKNQWQPQNIQVTDGILKYRKELKVGMDDENISWSKPVWCMSLYIPGCLLVIWLVYSSSMHGLNSNFHFPVY